jgi:hypothetical protein
MDALLTFARGLFTLSLSLGSLDLELLSVHRLGRCNMGIILQTVKHTRSLAAKY